MIFELPESIEKPVLQDHPGPWDRSKNCLISHPKNLNFPPFFSKIFFKKLFRNLYFYNELMKFSKNWIYYFNILHEKWHILKKNLIYHETKMSKNWHSAWRHEFHRKLEIFSDFVKNFNILTLHSGYPNRALQVYIVHILQLNHKFDTFFALIFYDLEHSEFWFQSYYQIRHTLNCLLPLLTILFH